MIMIEDIQKLLDDYTRWLKDKTVLKQAGADWVEVTTPHLGPAQRSPPVLYPQGRQRLSAHG